ncbi:MAG: carbohydrate kinase family protein [Moorellales bacterium]
MAGPQVVGMGSLNRDVFYRLADPRWLVEAGWPVVPGGEVFLPDEEMPALEDFLRRHGQYLGVDGGGSAANTVYALSRLGFSTAFLGAVGEDEAGDYLRRSLAPVDTRGVKTVNGRTGTAFIILDRAGERTIAVFPQANARLAEAGLKPEAVGLGPKATDRPRFLHLSSFVCAEARAVQEQLVASLPAGVEVSLDPGEIYARQGLGVLEPLLRHSRLVFVTRAELELLLPGEDETAAAQRILDLGPEVVVVKRGAGGSVIFTRREEIVVPAVPVTAVDTTGAGDVYDAGFLAGLLLGLPLASCGRLAAAAAAQSITGRGRAAYPDSGFLRRWQQEGGS